MTSNHSPFNSYLLVLSKTILVNASGKKIP